MLRYDILTGTIFIISIINFAFPAPVSVQDKHQSRVEVAHMGKRWGEEIEKLGEEYFKTSGKSFDSSGKHSPSSSAPNLASPAANPDPLMESPCSPSSSSMQGLRARGNCVVKMADALSYPYPMHGNGPMMYSMHRKLPMMEAPAPQPKPSIDPSHPPIAEGPSPSSTPPRPARPKVDTGQASGYGPGPPPQGSETEHTGPPGSEFYSTTVGPSPSPGAASPTESEHDVVPRPPPNPDPELHLDRLSLSTSSQPIDFQAANAAKGKAKESRPIFGTALDVGNAEQRDRKSVV